MIQQLSDKVIKKLARVPPEDYGASPNWWLRANQRVARKAEQEVMRQVAEYLGNDRGLGLVKRVRELQKQAEKDKYGGKGE